MILSGRNIIIIYTHDIIIIIIKRSLSLYLLSNFFMDMFSWLHSQDTMTPFSDSPLQPASMKGS